MNKKEISEIKKQFPRTVLSPASADVTLTEKSRTITSEEMFSNPFPEQ